MKKIFSFLVTLLFAGILFADTYKVENVKGKVFRLDGLGNQIKIEKNEVLNSNTILKIGISSELTLSCNGVKVLSKTPVNAIPIDDWFVKNRALKGGLKKATVVKASEVAPDVEKSRPGVATAASRASDAKEDFDWDE